MYNNQTLDTSSVALLRNNYPGPFLSVIDGTFSVFLNAGLTYLGGGIYIPTDTSLSQTGLIPLTAQSLQFKAKFVPPFISVSLDEQPISSVPLQVTPGYTLFGADVTAFQGQTKELRFTLFSPGVGSIFVLDSISFSNQPIPEPSVVCLLGLSFLLLGVRRMRRNSWNGWFFGSVTATRVLTH